jgi:glycosyltransferase involved in cell wall biosynthesis
MSIADRIPTMKDYHSRPGAAMISVVTTVRNADRTLGRTIASVRAQKIPGLEYLIIDGGSTDNTLDVIRANADIVSFWKSEPDCGISDGFNKGIALSSGKYVTLLNADDWLSPGQLAVGVAALQESGADFVFGDLVYYDTFGNPLHCVRGDGAYGLRLARTMPALNHPTLIMRRTAYERHGLFDLTLRYAMDYELLLRFHKAGCRGIYEPRMTGRMSLEGESDLHSVAALREVRDISIRHGYPAPAAKALYGFRLLKSRARRLMEKTLPRTVSMALRRLFNSWVTPA